MKVALLFDNFGPYHWARASAAAKVCDVLCVQFGSSCETYLWDSDQRQTIPTRTLNEAGPSHKLDRSTMGGRLAKVLSEYSPSVVVIPGWSTREALLALRWCRDNAIPAVVMSETTRHDLTRKLFREAIKQSIMKMFSAALVGGIPHRAYALELGFATECIFTGNNAVDNEHFSLEAARWRHENTGCRPYFLASNRFIARKNLHRLIDAYECCSSRTQWDLCLLGDGDLKPALMAQCRQLGLRVAECAPWEEETGESRLSSLGGEKTVFFPGFRQIDELPRFYANSRCFIHPALTEAWGLVVNEAMACGLPVLVSDRCGCAPDLVRDGENGFRFNPYKVNELAELMIKISDPDFSNAGFGSESRRIISEWGPDRFASGLKDAADKAVEIGPKRATILNRLILKGLLLR